MGLVVLIALACLRHWVCIYYICPQSLLTLLVQQSGSSGLNAYQRYSGVSVQQLLKSFVLTVQRLPILKAVDFSVSLCEHAELLQSAFLRLLLSWSLGGFNAIQGLNLGNIGFFFCIFCQIDTCHQSGC